MSKTGFNSYLITAILHVFQTKIGRTPKKHAGSSVKLILNNLLSTRDLLFLSNACVYIIISSYTTRVRRITGQYISNSVVPSF